MAIDSVTVQNLSKRFGFHRALAGVDLTVEGGGLCALLGPNGAGKSTLLGIVSTLVRPTGGEVTYAEGSRTIDHGSELRRQIGILSHDSLVYGGLTGLENLLFWGKLYSVEDAEDRCRTLLQQVELEERVWDRPASTYSRGMMQRLSLARALLHDPALLLLDEPFTGLDRGGARALAETLREAVARERIALVVTHDLESIAEVTNHVAVLQRGKVVYEDRSEGFSYRELVDVYHRYTEV